jgi:hypothetical protein
MCLFHVVKLVSKKVTKPLLSIVQIWWLIGSMSFSSFIQEFLIQDQTIYDKWTYDYDLIFWVMYWLAEIDSKRQKNDFWSASSSSSTILLLKIRDIEHDWGRAVEIFSHCVPQPFVGYTYWDLKLTHQHDQLMLVSVQKCELSEMLIRVLSVPTLNSEHPSHGS